MGLSVDRGEKKKGILGTRETVRGITSFEGLPVEYIQDIGFNAALQKEETEIRRLFPERAYASSETLRIIKKTILKQGESRINAAVRKATEDAGEAAKESALAMGITASGNLGGVEQSAESLLRDEKFGPPLKRISQEINLYATSPSFRMPRSLPPISSQDKWIALAFNSFAGPIARVITEARFSDLSALANLRGSEKITKNEIASAAFARPSAEDLKNGTVVKTDKRGSFILDELLSFFTHSKFDKLQKLLGEPEPDQNTSSNTGVSLGVYEKVINAAVNARKSEQQLIGSAITSRNNLYESLKQVIASAQEAEPEGVLVTNISIAYAGMGGGLGDLINQIAKINDNTAPEIRDIMQYIKGSCLEPIRQNDIDEMRKTKDVVHHFEVVEPTELIQQEREDPANLYGRRTPPPPRDRSRDRSPSRESEEDIFAGDTSGDVNPTVSANRRDPDDDLSESRLLEALHRVLMRKASAGQPRA